MAKKKIQTVKVITKGKMQLIMLPENLHINSKEVYVKLLEGNKIVLSPKTSALEDFFYSEKKCTSDFLNKRIDDIPQVRDIF